MSLPPRSESPSDSAAPVVSILVVSYNTREITLACLASLRDTAGDVDYELIVVDNASSDGSGPAIAAAHPEARTIQLSENIGFGRANNLAAQEAQGDYILLLNPDTVVLEGAIQSLLAFAHDRPQARIWGGRTLFPDGTLNPTSCWGAPSVWTLFCHVVGLARVFPRSSFFNAEAYGDWQRDSIRQVAIVTGCFLLIDRPLWDELGGFDPQYFIYGEEADLCLRAHDHGARPAITPKAEIIHLDGASEPVRADRAIRLQKGKVTLIRKHWSPPAQGAGMFLLRLMVVARLVAFGILAAITKQDRFVRRAQEWRTIWAARHEWLAGYPPFHDESPDPS